MKASQVLLVVAAAVLSCEARHWAAGDDRIPEDDADTIFTVEERPAFPFAPEHLEPYVAQEGVAVPVVPVVPQPHSLTRRSTTVFRPLFATRERDAERREQQERRREQQERRREYWAGEERRRSAAAYPAPRRPQPQPYPYRPYPGAYPGAYAAYPAAGR